MNQRILKEKNVVQVDLKGLNALSNTLSRSGNPVPCDVLLRQIVKMLVIVFIRAINWFENKT